MTGIITDVQRFCLSDGDGIRTMVFFKGCPLRCAWCHNPETHQFGSQLMFYGNECRDCGACVRACPQGLDPRKPNVDCTLCGACAMVCPHGALKMSGTATTEEALLAKLLRDRTFYGKYGGVTFSGGEPLAQPQFLLRMLKLCREKGVNTAVETCGYAPEETMAAAAAMTDCLLFDIKTMDPQKHMYYAGVDNGLILKNLANVLDGGARVIVRLPIIPGVNDTVEDARSVAVFLNRHPRPAGAELLSYHDMGAEKYAALHILYPAQGTKRPETAALQAYQAALVGAGIPCTIAR